MHLKSRRLHVIGGLAVLAATAITTNALASPGGGAVPARVAPAAASATAASPTGLRVPSVTPASGKPATVALITGDRVKLGADGNVLSVTPPSGDAAPYAQFTWSGDKYVIPASAVPYLSSTLDIRLFDVSYLARTPSAARPLAIAGTAAGRAAVASGGTFRTMLASHWRTHALPGISRVSLSQAASALPAAPAGASSSAAAGGIPFRTLTINPVGRDGNPSVALILVQNLRDAALSAFLTDADGPASYSVPEGDYSVMADIFTPASDGTDGSLVANPQFQVRDDTTITLDARAAHPYYPTVDPADPSWQGRFDGINVFRSSQAGGDVGLNGYLLGLRSLSPIGQRGRSYRTRLYLAPTRQVTEGTFTVDGFTNLTPTGFCGDATSTPLAVLSFPYAGAIPDISFDPVITREQLTTVHDEIYKMPDNDAGNETSPLTFFPMLSWGGVNDQCQVAVPGGARDDYLYSSNPGLETWFAQVFEWGGAEYNAPIPMTPGKQVSQTWNKAPYGVGPGSSDNPSLGGDIQRRLTAPVLLTSCAACRQGNSAMLSLQASADSSPAHLVWRGTPVTLSELRFYQDGRLAFSSAPTPSGSIAPMDVYLPMAAKPASYALDWKTSRQYDPQASVQTDWSFRSSPGDPATALSGNVRCAPDPSLACSALPLLFPVFDLPLDYSSHAQAGTPFDVAFSVQPMAGAPAPRGVTTTVSVSYDSGATWTAPRAATAGGDGKFRLTINQPSLAQTDGWVALRVTAKDASGNAVTQTLIRAYALS